MPNLHRQLQHAKLNQKIFERGKLPALYEIDDKGRVNLQSNSSIGKNRIPYIAELTRFSEWKEAQPTTLDVLPEEFHSLVAKLVEGRFWIPCFSDKALQQGITDSATRINYGISRLQNAPAATAVWRWETVQTIFDTFESDLKTALIVKRAKLAEEYESTCGAGSCGSSDVHRRERPAVCKAKASKKELNTTVGKLRGVLVALSDNSPKLSHVESGARKWDNPTRMDCSSPNLNAETPTPARKRGAVSQTGPGKRKSEVDQKENSPHKQYYAQFPSFYVKAHTEVAPHNLHLPSSDSGKKYTNYLWNKNPTNSGKGIVSMQTESIYDDSPGWFKFLKFSENIRPPWFVRAREFQRVSKARGRAERHVCDIPKSFRVPICANTNSCCLRDVPKLTTEKMIKETAVSEKRADGTELNPNSLNGGDNGNGQSFMQDV
ncbi:hypothetical protein BJ742DRAFT_738635 [Cladochytrium replicatum]|nr:hypothetical protein BJ742DRAFT_738635 [Cladochytrium replicatum]